MKRRPFSALIALAAGCVLSGPLTVVAQAGYPDKTVRIVVPYPPGGATDLSARLLAGEMGRLLGQSVIVENKPGVAGVIGTDLVAKSPADGCVFQRFRTPVSGRSRTAFQIDAGHYERR